MASNYNYGGYTAPESITSKEQVKKAQAEMAGAGYSPGNIDGLWGPRTQAAYEQYSASRAQQAPQQQRTAPQMYGGDFGMGAMNAAANASIEAAMKQYEMLKEQARKDAEAQGMAAYQDYAAYINPYGLQREARAGIGLGGSGIAESSQLGAYNTWQNRAYGVNRDKDRLLAGYESELSRVRADQQMALAQAQQQAEAARAAQANWMLDYDQRERQFESQRTQTQFDFQRQ